MTDLATTEPVVWLVIFHRHSSAWWLEMLPTEWKHVSAVAVMPGTTVWVHLSWELGRLRVEPIADEDFDRWLTLRVADGGLLSVKAPAFDVGPWRPRGLFCCSMISHLLGLKRGALWPSRLWRLLVSNGAEIFADGGPFQTQGEASAGDPAGNAGSRERRPRAA
jgi:hypothetical protein